MTRPISRVLVLSPLLVLLVCIPRAAAQSTTASLQGTVSDQSQAMVPGATVTLRDVNTGFLRTTTSDREGRYVLPFVPPGTYALTVELSGFKTLQREGLRFEIGQEASIDVRLELSTVAEVVTVRQDTPPVSPTKSTVDQIISREQIENLPLSGRQATSLALLAPGVVQSGGEPTTGGQPRGSAEMIIDGVSNELMAVNQIRSNAPPDAIQEFQVITSQYQAEFGHASGLILNALTRSGTNDLQGRAYYFKRDESLDARNAFQTTKARFEQTQAGGWLGGPIIRDRTHFFATYEATRRLTIATVTSPLARGDYDRPFENNQVLGKLTHQLTNSNQVTARVLFDRPVTHNAGVGNFNLPDVAYDSVNEDLAYVGNLTTVVSQRSLNELRVQVSFARIGLDPKQPDALTIIRPSSTSGKVRNVPQAFDERRIQIVDNWTHDRGAHRLKAGVDINHVRLDGYVYQDNPGTFQFSTDRPFDAADPTTYPILFIGSAGDPNFLMNSTGVSLFAQDTWLLPRHVTANVGVRYDAWDVTGLDLRKGSVAPRLAATWDPFGAGTTSIRAGFGVFYNNVLTNVPVFTDFLSRQSVIQISNPGYPDPFTRGTTLPQPPAGVYVAQPDQRLPRAYHTTLGVQREVMRGISVTADYVNSKGRELIRIVDLNPIAPPTFTRPDPTRNFVRTLESSGFSNYHGLLVSGKGRIGARGTVQVAYTLSSYKTTTEAENGIPQQDDLSKDDSYGYGNVDQRHRAVIGGYATLPGDIQIGLMLTARSGTPFNVTTGRDNNRNQNPNDRPDLVSGEIGSDAMRNRASFVDPGTRPGNLPRNAGRGDGQWTLDARLGKRVRVRGFSAEVLVDAFNVTNRVNFGNPVGNLGSGSFGQPNSAGDARQVQIGVRFGF